MSESVLTLRTWVIQESEFQTVASETMHGLTGKASGNQPLQPLPRNNNQRAFFGETEGNDRATKTVSLSVMQKVAWDLEVPSVFGKTCARTMECSNGVPVMLSLSGGRACRIIVSKKSPVRSE